MASPLPLGLDATYTLDPQPTGVTVYSREILLGMAELTAVRAYYRAHRFRRALQAPLPKAVTRRVLTDWAAPSVDIFHGLNQRLPKRIRGRSVVTFHDLFVLTAEYSTPEFRARFGQFSKDAAARASAIIAVSEFTARQVESLLGVKRARIRVIPHGVHLPDPETLPQKREKVILHVGAIQARKNVIRLIEAFERLPDGWRLVLAGGAGYGAEPILERASRSARAASIQITGYVSEQVLSALYRQAAILAFPSLDEGFGIPILDAMANGVAVVTSGRSATAEVAGDAAILIDPYRVDELTEALQKLAADESLRTKLVQAGLERASEYSWKRAVTGTYEVYKTLGL